MFNQFRTALESVAQPIRILDIASPEPNGDKASRSSLDLQGARSASLSSSQIADSAMSSLRKSFASQGVTPAPDVTKSPSATPATRKSTLEERLRRAAQASAAGEAASGASGSSPASPRGRSDSASQTKLLSSRITSSSPATRGRTADTSKSPANKPPSRTASPATSSGTRVIGSSGLGSKPSSRSSSPIPASKPSSRVSSPAPVSRASTTQRTASPGPTRTPSRPPSRAGSPTPAARTRRTSELANRCSRAASPSPLTKHQSPLRRSSIVVNNTPPLSNSPNTTSASVDSTDFKAELTTTSEDEVSLVSTDDKEEYETTEDLTPAQSPEVSMVQSGDSEEVVPTGQERESQTRMQNPPSENELEQLTVESSDNATVEPALAEVTIDPSEPTAKPLQADTTDVAANEQSSPRQQTGVQEENVPEELQSKEKAFPEVSVTPVIRQKRFSDVDLSSSNKPNVSSPDLVTTVSEPPKSCTTDQETELHNGIPDTDRSAEIESLQAKLKEVEQRVSDVSISFKRLQAEKLAADTILREHSPLESFNDPNALRDYFSNLRIKDEVFQEEIKRLTGKLELQDDQLQELHELHKLETKNLSEELRQTKTQLRETEVLFEAAQRATSNVETTADKRKEEMSRLEKELERSKNLAKEEEEKRVKAITLLKTVRQKLVKAEKDREDAMKEMAMMKEREKGDKDQEQIEKLTLLREVEILQSAHAQEIAGLRAHSEKDLAATRERYEQEVSALKGQHDLDLATVKISLNKELASKSSQISSLEHSLNSATRDKNSFFEQLQLRQAELESAHAQADTIQHQNTELEFQLREANDRLALVREEYAELQREVETRSRDPTSSAEEMARMVSATEAKYEARVAEMKRNISVLEKERHESEVDWSRKLKEKVRELEDLKRMLGSATRMRETEENMQANLKAELEAAQETNTSLRREVAQVTLLKGQIEELERSLKEQEHETDVKVRVLEKQIDEHKAREAQLKQGNKTLREELRKVQSSAALLERQRNPGVGFWGRGTPGGGSASGDAANGSVPDSRVSISSPAETPPRSSSPTPSSASTKTEEEVNLEYVRNVVLQFLEHKERRPQLVKVLSIILQFTPQETRRLIAKV